jgi:Kdo2-lipid IVA lauroyltransferase/acyltransferase
MMNYLTLFLKDIPYLALRAAIKLIRWLPYNLAIRLSRFIGIIIWLADSFHRKVAAIQIRTALGVENPWRLAMKVFMNQTEMIVDTIRYAYMSDEEIKSRIVVEGKEHMDEAQASGRGVMMISGHISNWEILGHIPRVLGIPFCVMVNTISNPKLEAIVNDIRDRCGATTLPSTGSFHMLTDELKKGKTIGWIIDLRGDRKEDVYCDVFGMPAPSKSAPASLALRGNALVMPVYITKENGTFHWHFAKAVDSAKFGGGDEAIQKLSDFMQSWVTSVVMEHPESWSWLYTRWLKRSDMRKVIHKKLDFRDYVLNKNTKNEPIRSEPLAHTES